MELPYHAISDAEAQLVADDLAAVALAAGDVALVRRIQATWGANSGGGGKAAGASRLSDVAPQPDG
jgi:hypothetical protein